MYFNFGVFSLLFALFSFICFLLGKMKIKTCLLIASFIFYLCWFFRLAFWSLPTITLSVKTLLHFGKHQKLNFIFLMPLGFYLVFLFKIKNHFLLLLLSFLIPFFIELSQEYLFLLNKKFIYHTFSYEDIFFNFWGCFIASIISLYFYKKRVNIPIKKQ